MTKKGLGFSNLKPFFVARNCLELHKKEVKTTLL